VTLFTLPIFDGTGTLSRGAISRSFDSGSRVLVARYDAFYTSLGTLLAAVRSLFSPGHLLGDMVSTSLRPLPPPDGGDSR
jgi:hypothetical protein